MNKLDLLNGYEILHVDFSKYGGHITPSCLQSLQLHISSSKRKFHCVGRVFMVIACCNKASLQILTVQEWNTLVCSLSGLDKTFLLPASCSQLGTSRVPHKGFSTETPSCLFVRMRLSVAKEQ